MSDGQTVSAPRMVARVWTKKQAQAVIGKLREAGLKVNMTAAGLYECYSRRADNPSAPKRLIFSALIGKQTYLVRHAEDLFEVKK